MKIMCMWASYKKKIWEIIFLFCILIVTGSGFGSWSITIVRGEDPGIRIRTKMSWIPNSAKRYNYRCKRWVQNQNCIRMAFYLERSATTGFAAESWTRLLEAAHLGAREALYGAPVEAGYDSLRPQLQDGTADIPHEPVMFWTQGFTFK